MGDAVWLATVVYYCFYGDDIAHSWKLFRYGVKRDHYDKFISIREFLERIAVDCSNNSFTT